MPRFTFAREFNKQLPPAEDGTPLAIHYLEGHSYDVPDDLVAEVQPYVAPEAETQTAVPLTHVDQPG